MTSILEFPKRPLCPPAPDCAVSADLTALVSDLFVQTKDVLLQAISLLDLAARQGRELAEQIGDPAKKAVAEADVEMVATALDTARIKALEI